MTLRKRFSKLIFSILFVLFLVFSVGFIVSADDDLDYQFVSVIKSQELGEGVNWTSLNAKTKETTVSVASSYGAQTVNILSCSPSSGCQIVTWANMTTNGMKRAKIVDICKDYEKNHPDMEVLAAVNGDYFVTSSTATMTTRDPLAMDGAIINGSPDSTAKARLVSIGIYDDMQLRDDGKNFVATSKGGALEISENYFLDIYDLTGSYVIKSIELDGYNATAKDGETTVVNLSKTVVLSGKSTMFKVNCTSNSNITQDVAYKDTLGRVDYILGTTGETIKYTDETTTAISTMNEEIINLLTSTRKVKIYRKLAGKYEGLNSVFGAPQQTINNGNVLAASDIVNYGSHRDLRRARTVIGFKRDGTVLLMTYDEYYTGASGATVREAAQGLKANGCVYGFGMDGGGSTTCVIKENGSFKITNKPSDGSPRSCGNAVLIVKPKLQGNLDLTESKGKHNNEVLLTGKIEVNNPYDSGILNLYVDEEKKVVNFNDVKLTLEEEKTYDIAVFWESGTTKKLMYHTTITTGSYEDLKVPILDYELIEDDNKLVFNINIIDTDEVLKEVKLKINNEEVELKYNDGTLSYEIIPTETMDYVFDVSYVYQVEKENEENLNLDSYIYNYVKPRNPMHPINFALTLTGINETDYKVKLTYDANTTIVSKILLVIEDNEIEYYDDAIVNGVVSSIKVTYDDFGVIDTLVLNNEEFKISIDEFVPIVESETEEPIEPKEPTLTKDPIPIEPGENSGCKNYLVALFISLISIFNVLAFIIKKH